jgi:glycosyltransferase involved in cell wall biosynthesis
MQHNASHTESIAVIEQLLDRTWYRRRYEEVAGTDIDPCLDYLINGVAAGRNPHPLFDTEFYIATNPDVLQSGFNPLIHFLKYGASEDRNPHPLFDSKWYLERLPTTEKRPENLLLHFLARGAALELDPHPLFSVAFYLEQNADVLKTGINPLVHYLERGASEGRDPHPLFNTSFYLQQNLDVAESGINPLVHFVLHGATELRDPHPLFQTPFYVRDNRDVAESQVNPLIHYIEHGAREQRNPNPLFDSEFYITTNPDVLQSGSNPLIHFLKYGASEGRNPHPLFDSKWYLEQFPTTEQRPENLLLHFLARGAALELDPHPLFSVAFYLEQNADVLKSGINPLVHYLESGASEGRDPHPLFSTSHYLQRNLDVADSGLNPLSHFVLHGAAELRDPHPLFQTPFYVRDNREVAESKVNPLIHYIEQGAREGRNPNPHFDTQWYLEQNEAVIGSNENPLSHYVMKGWREGRSPSRSFDIKEYLARHPAVRDSGIEPLHHFLSAGPEVGVPEPSHSGDIPPHELTYREWLKPHDVTPAQLGLQTRISRGLSKRVTISLVVPVYKITSNIIRQLLQSVLRQSYPYWELCICLAYHDDPDLTSAVAEAALQDSRIKVTKMLHNAGISGNSNAALALATGEYIALLDHDDVIAPDALFEAARTIEREPQVDLIYSDKDMVDESGSDRFNPLFKPGWSPEIMLNANYLTHFNIIRRERVLEIGGWDSATDGAQDWDLFLRVVGKSGRVAHIPKVLYHWRVVASSVAAGGLSAKPYAADAQLLSVDRYLRVQGWSGAKAKFASPNLIKIDWSSPLPFASVGMLVLGSNSGEAAEWMPHVHDASEIVCLADLSIAELNKAIERMNVEVVLICPSGLEPIAPDWVAQLVGPLENSDIGIVTGKLLGRRSEIIDSGWVVDEDLLKPLFRGLERHAYTNIGSVDWFRNVTAASFATMAFRKSDWSGIGGFGSHQRPDLAFAEGIRKAGRRIMYNPFAEAWLNRAEGLESLLRLKSGYVPPRYPESVRYFSPNLRIESDNTIALSREAPEATASKHDFTAEARYVARAYDYTRRDILNSSQACSRFTATGLDTVAWFVPDFNMPFYGGILTILRAADYMRRNGIQSHFVGVGTASPERLRGAISLAFPELAAGAKVSVLKPNEDVNALGLGPLHAAICTLWTTAYPLLKLRNVAEKFYFVQDYEPLFYPAGTTAALAEATYRFGFKGICNTEPLATLYRSHGGEADFFVPAVDRNIFHSRGRSSEGPIQIFSYARPGHPRNCFEVVTEGLRLVKAELGQGVQIFTAGADWRVEEYGLDGIVDHLGLLSYEETADLYRACDIGVVAMATRHPSYLPLELMACGALVCTNASPSTSWLLQAGENCLLFDLSRSSVAETILFGAKSAALRSRITAQAVKTVDQGHANWEAVCAAILAMVFPN